MCLQVFDNVVLGAWVHKVRKLRKEKRLPAEQVRGPLLNPKPCATPWRVRYSPADTACWYRQAPDAVHQCNCLPLLACMPTTDG